MEHASKKYDDLELRRHGVAGASIYTSLIMNSMSGGGGNVAPSITGVPTISGDTDVGDLLTATAAGVTGIPTPVRTWQWTRNGVDISGATNATYTIQAADDGTAIRVRQIETNSEGSDTATSNPVSVVDVFAPTISGVPTISGTTGEGDTLTASPASVTGVPTPTRTWQWYRDAGAISGATSITYTLVSADLGTDITVVQTETNAEGTDTATSAATSIPGGLATAMRVRESSGNAEADIPLAVDGFVDGTALTTHTGAASGFVTVWHDQSGNDNDATQVTTTAQPRIVNAGTVDEALVFDGTNDYLQLSNVIDLSTTDFTVSAWVNLANWGDSKAHGIVGVLRSGPGEGSWILNKGGNNLFQLFTADNAGLISIGYDVSTLTGWQHLSASFVNSTKLAKLFLNGVEVASATLTKAPAFRNLEIRIGSQNNLTSGQFLQGKITDLRIYASNESANIAGIYAGTYEGSPVAWYKATEIAHSMRVRESSGNAERNILVGDGGYVDETDLLDHVGANSGFVTSWQDRSGLGNHAVQSTQVSQPRIVNAGTVDEALVFDGSNDFLTLTTPLSFAGEFTVAMWCKRDTTTNHTLIGASPGTNEQFFFNGPNELRVRVFNGGTLSSVAHAVTSTSWNHYAITRDADNKVSLYSNGVFRGKFFADAAQVGTCNLGRIGADIFGSVVYDGSLDQVYAANVALSEAQIAALMNGTLPASGTVLYLKAKDVAP